MYFFASILYTRSIELTNTMSESTATAPRRRRRVGGGDVSKLKAKLDEYFASGKYYEAQQMYQTMFNRLSGADKHEEAGAQMKQGCLRLLEFQQVCHLFLSLSFLFVCILLFFISPRTFFLPLFFSPSS